MPRKILLEPAKSRESSVLAAEICDEAPTRTHDRYLSCNLSKQSFKTWKEHWPFSLKRRQNTEERAFHANVFAEEKPRATASPSEVIAAIITFLGKADELFLGHPIWDVVIALPHELMKRQSKLLGAIEQVNPWKVKFIEESAAATRMRLETPCLASSSSSEIH
jgi:hypothetical protein